MAFGGSICKIRSDDVRRKDCYRWYIYGNPAGAILEVLLPYLIVKKKHALLAIEFCLSTDKNTKARITVELTTLNKTGR